MLTPEKNPAGRALKCVRVSGSVLFQIPVDVYGKHPVDHCCPFVVVKHFAPDDGAGGGEEPTGFISAYTQPLFCPALHVQVGVIPVVPVYRLKAEYASRP